MAFCRKNKVGLMGLLETKVRICNYESVAQNFLGWQHYVHYNNQQKGRLWLTWIPEDFTIHILQSTKQTIHCWVLHSFSGRTFYLTLVYGDNEELRRTKLWELLQDLETSIATLQIIMGDFNYLLHLDDRMEDSQLRSMTQGISSNVFASLEYRTQLGNDADKPGLTNKNLAQESTLELITFQLTASGWTPTQIQKHTSQLKTHQITPLD